MPGGTVELLDLLQVQPPENRLALISRVAEDAQYPRPGEVPPLACPGTLLQQPGLQAAQRSAGRAPGEQLAHDLGLALLHEVLAAPVFELRHHLRLSPRDTAESERGAAVRHPLG